MLRLIALSCLVLSVLAVEQVPLDSDSPLERAGGGIQKFNAGKRVAGDKLIWTGTGNQMIDFARVITMELPFPQESQTNNAVITQIVATTALDAGNTQFSIENGGVGQKSVTLKIVSTNAHKVSYKVQIYGK